jgi:hypothetical protein
VGNNDCALSKGWCCISMYIVVNSIAYVIPRSSSSDSSLRLKFHVERFTSIVCELKVSQMNIPEDGIVVGCLIGPCQDHVAWKPV